MSANPKYLYHGTRDSVLPAIAEAGLLPRVMTGNGNWDHSSPSHEEAVYLTTAYPLHFAINSALPGNPCILRIRADALDPSDLVGDEDSYALIGATHPDLPDSLDVPARVQFWRERLDETDAATSLSLLGNCAHRGSIPKEAIDCVVVMSDAQAAQLVLAFADPVIAPANFRFLGRDHMAFTDWLFSEEPSWSPSFGNAVASPGRLQIGPLASFATPAVKDRLEAAARTAAPTLRPCA